MAVTRAWPLARNTRGCGVEMAMYDIILTRDVFNGAGIIKPSSDRRTKPGARYHMCMGVEWQHYS